MPLSSLFQRFRQMATTGHGAAPEAVHVSQADVEAARVRARRRLIGMVVLVGAGVIGFPWLFETEPRSMSQDVEMVQANTGFGGADGGLSVARGAPRAVVGNVAGSGLGKGSGPGAGKVAVADIVPPPQERPAVAQRRPPVREPKVSPAKEAAAKPVAKATEKPAEKAPDKSDTRYVVQFGAFADASAAQAARMKVERLGVKTYAQQVDTPGGKRIRVRIGPFTDRAEADKAMITVRKAGLTGAVLTL